MSNIHPTAIVEPGAKIGNNVTVEAYAIIKSNVVLEDNVTIKSFVYIDGYTTIGQGTVIWPSACIGTKTQDLKYKGEKTFVIIGKNCEIREYVTINSSCQENTAVKIGDNCLIMACCHIAHNCELGNRVIMANGSLLAGHVTVEDNVTIGGMSAVHQFCRIGKYAMVGGFSAVTQDVPPYTIGRGEKFKIAGLNLVGLRRHQFSFENRKALAHAYRLTYKSGLTLKDAFEKIENEVPLNEHVIHWLQFCKGSKRGLIGFLYLNEENLDKDIESKEIEEIISCKL
ncbi:MAG: acyl-ACP--UDP-N-acetylglucosamine O-acyltransferase [Chlamydiae bacterium]|nr:acyl-ACP--UDP-N-acetylglucosamine O-acyltransferase [Chlamydiota bacterium]